jgi:hypothetical protein
MLDHPTKSDKQTFIIGAFILALIAFITQSVARDYVEKAMHWKAERLELAQKEHIAYTPDLRGRQLSKSADVLTVIGCVITVLSFVCMITALARHESGWYLILILILFFDLTMPMLL